MRGGRGALVVVNWGQGDWAIENGEDLRRGGSDILDTGDCAAVHTQTTEREDCFSSNIFYTSYKMKK